MSSSANTIYMKKKNTYFTLASAASKPRSATVPSVSSIPCITTPLFAKLLRFLNSGANKAYSFTRTAIKPQNSVVPFSGLLNEPAGVFLFNILSWEWYKTSYFLSGHEGSSPDRRRRIPTPGSTSSCWNPCFSLMLAKLSLNLLCSSSDANFILEDKPESTTRRGKWRVLKRDKPC